MIKKMIVGGVLIIIGFFLIIFQLNAIEQIKDKDELVRVYTISKDISLGDMVKNEDLTEIYIRKEDKKSEYISDLYEKPQYCLLDKKKNSILLKSDLSKEKPINKFLMEDKNNIITLSLGIEEANAWDFKEYDQVDLYFVSNYPDRENHIYEDVIIYKIRNADPFRDEYSNIQTPQYVSILVEKEKSYEILSNKRYGRYEIVLN